MCVTVCFALGLHILPVNSQWRVHRSGPQVVNYPGEERVVLKVGAPNRRVIRTDVRQVNYPGEECTVLKVGAPNRRVIRTDVRQVVNHPGRERVVLKVGASYRREALITRPMDAALDKSGKHTDATRDKSGMHTDAALDESDRQSVTTGLWQFSDREELHEAGRYLPPPDTSSSGCLPPPRSSGIF